MAGQRDERDESALRLRQVLTEARTAAGPQGEFAKKLGRTQTFVSNYQSRERKVGVVEFVLIARELGFHPGGGVFGEGEEVEAAVGGVGGGVDPGFGLEGAGDADRGGMRDAGEAAQAGLGKAAAFEPGGVEFEQHREGMVAGDLGEIIGAAAADLDDRADERGAEDEVGLRGREGDGRWRGGVAAERLGGLFEDAGKGGEIGTVTRDCLSGRRG